MVATDADLEHQVEHYMELPYRIELIPDPEAGGYVVTIPDLPYCMSQGDTVEEALEMIRDAQRGWLTVALRHGDVIPEPRSEDVDEQEYSGKFNVRIPKGLHRDLVHAATRDGVSLNTFVVSALARAAGHRDGAEPVVERPRLPG